MKRIAQLFMLLLCGTSAVSSAASFDCAKAKSSAEKLICSDPELSTVDDALAVTFADAKARAIDKVAFREEQRQAWNWRERNCADRICLLGWYQKRMEALKRIAETGAVTGFTSAGLVGGIAVPAAATKRPPPAKKYVTPTEITKTYRENGIAAARRYTDQAIAVVARVAHVGIDINKLPYVVAYTNFPGTFVKMVFEPRSIDALAKLHNLDAIRADCVGDGMDTTNTVVMLTCGDFSFDADLTKRIPGLPRFPEYTMPTGNLPGMVPPSP